MGRLAVPGGDPDLEIRDLRRRLAEIDRRTIPTPEQVAMLPRGEVARGIRKAGNIAPLAGGVVRNVLSVAAPVTAGRSYRIEAALSAWVDGQGASYGEAFLYRTTDGTAPVPGTASQELGHAVFPLVTGGGIPYPLALAETYVPIADGTVRVLLWVRMGEPARTYGVYADAAAGISVRLWITDVGVDPGVSSTDH